VNSRQTTGPTAVTMARLHLSALLLTAACAWGGTGQGRIAAERTLDGGDQAHADERGSEYRR